MAGLNKIQRVMAAPKSNRVFSEGSKSKGILDDYATRKTVDTSEGTIQKTPVNAKDIVNKEYVDSVGGTDWTVDQSPAVIHANNYVDNDTTYVSSDFNHDDLTGVSANEHIDWTNATDSIVTTGDITATTFHGSGSELTDVGASAATAVTISGKAAENITQGQAVYVSGSVGSLTQFSLADNTVSTKTDVIGIATTTQTTGQTILVRVLGQLNNWDTDTPGWSDGDTIFLSTGGDLTNTRPTSGVVIHMGDVEVAHAITGKFLVHFNESKRDKGSPSGLDLSLRMGDSIGTNKVIFKDYGNNEVAAVDSDGNITTSGTVDGIDIATDVAANTAKISYTDAVDVGLNTADRHAPGSDDQVSGDFTHDDLTGVSANEHLDWTTDLGATNINAANYTDTNTQLSEGDITTMGFTKDVEVDWTVDQSPAVINAANYTDTGDTTYVSSDFVHDDLTGFEANEHFTQGAISIPASQISDFDTEVANNSAVTANTSKVSYTDAADVSANTSARHAESHTVVSHSDTTATGAELDTLTGGGDTTLHDHDGISENTAARHTQNTDTALGSGCVAADHGTASTDQIINVSYGTGSAPTANTTTIGSLFVKYTA